APSTRVGPLHTTSSPVRGGHDLPRYEDDGAYGGAFLKARAVRSAEKTKRREKRIKKRAGVADLVWNDDAAPRPTNDTQFNDPDLQELFERGYIEELGSRLEAARRPRSTPSDAVTSGWSRSFTRTGRCARSRTTLRTGAVSGSATNASPRPCVRARARVTRPGRRSGRCAST